MKRLFVVYNPQSSRYADVKEDVLKRLKDLSGYIVGKYEVEEGNVDDNAAKFAKLLEDNDLVISAGGDATGVIAANAILKSRKNVTLAVLPYGNFNDLSRTLGTRKFEDVFSGRVVDYYPLEIFVDNNFFRYATCYVTVGMMAEAVKIYDQPRMRRILKTAPGRNIGSYTNLAAWYFKHRHKKEFLPEFKLNKALQPKKTSDYIAVNSRHMARVMQGGEYFGSPQIFRSKTDKLTSFWRLIRFMARSIFIRVPGDDTKSDVLEFCRPATIKIQAEGEFKPFNNVGKVEIKKSKRCLRVVTH